MLIADGLVVRSESEHDPHWNESASQFLSGLILHAGLGPAVPEDARNLAAVRRLALSALQRGADGKSYVLREEEVRQGSEWLRALGLEDEAQAIEGAMNSFYEKSTNEMASVLSSVRRHTQFLDFRAMKNVLRARFKSC